MKEGGGEVRARTEAIMASEPLMRVPPMIATGTWKIEKRREEKRGEERRREEKRREEKNRRVSEEDSSSFSFEAPLRALVAGRRKRQKADDAEMIAACSFLKGAALRPSITSPLRSTVHLPHLLVLPLLLRLSHISNRLELPLVQRIDLHRLERHAQVLHHRLRLAAERADLVLVEVDGREGGGGEGSGEGEEGEGGAEQETGGGGGEHGLLERERAEG